MPIPPWDCGGCDALTSGVTYEVELQIGRHHENGGGDTGWLSAGEGVPFPALAVSDLRVTRGNSQLTLRWKAPFTGVPGVFEWVRGYDVQYRRSNGGWIAHGTYTGITTDTIPTRVISLGLIPPADVHVRVRPRVYRHGTGTVFGDWVTWPSTASGAAGVQQQNAQQAGDSGTGGDRGVIAQGGSQEPPPALYTSLIADVNDWRNDPRYVSHKPHTDRWDRVLLSLGEPTTDTSLTPMRATEAQGYADRGWTRWVGVAEALRAIVTGTSDDNTLTGTSNGELLVGLGGADTLSGLGGDDELRGGDGDDDLSGGAGRDRFVFFFGETGENLITDFESGDVIVLKGSGWDSVADIIASVIALTNGKDYLYALDENLTVETINNRPLRTEDFVTD